MSRNSILFALTFSMLTLAHGPAAQADAGDESAPAAASAAAAGRIGPGQPAVVIAATDDVAMVQVLLRDIEGELKPDGFSIGMLVNAANPHLMTRPSVELVESRMVVKPGNSSGQARDYDLKLRIKGLFAFGDNLAPLLYQGREVEALRFSKPGLVVEPTGAAGHIAREGEDLLFTLVLVNPSDFEYPSVRARLRFVDRDVCLVQADRFNSEWKSAPAASASNPAGGTPSLLGDGAGSGSGPWARLTDGLRRLLPFAGPPAIAVVGEGATACTAFRDWVEFAIPRHAQITLRVKAAPEWFRDPDSGIARSGKKRGQLTLRYGGKDPVTIQEQNLPIEVQFEPSTSSQFRSLMRVAFLLLVGAVVSLLLRVSVPNYKRKSGLKDQLAEIGKMTAAISTEVDSTLRVLLRVERLALDEIRMASSAVGPGYADYAQRVEQGLPTLKRRVDMVRRLDSTLIRLRLLLEQNPAPTRVEQIEGHLDVVSEALKQDHLGEEDWVLVSQRLEAAQKLLREPTQTEKEAFDSLLSGRWKAIHKHFAIDGKGPLVVPQNLHGLEACFPSPTLLPQDNDPDGTIWIQSVGPARADLQLYALALLCDFEFLVPNRKDDEIEDPRWTFARGMLIHTLATPVIGNLRKAKSFLRQLAEDTPVAHIIAALKNGAAMIRTDPPVPRPNQRIRFSVRFREDRLNACAARELVTCSWSFIERKVSALDRARVRLPAFVTRFFSSESETDEEGGSESIPVCEDGWTVHHYFEKNVAQIAVSVAFHDEAGNEIKLAEVNAPDVKWFNQVLAVQRSSRKQERWARFWLEMFQLGAALLVPLATMASQTTADAVTGNWWQLVAIGFASDTVKNILVGRQEAPLKS